MSFINGLAGALLAIFLTPLLQHYFWSFQRLSELRLNVINDVTNLIAKYLTNCIKESVNNHEYTLDKEFLQSLMAVEDQVQALFSATAVSKFKELSAMIGTHSTEGKTTLPKFQGLFRTMTVEEFNRAKENMLRALYNEVLPLESRWKFFKAVVKKPKV